MHTSPASCTDQSSSLSTASTTVTLSLQWPVSSTSRTKLSHAICARPSDVRGGQRTCSSRSTILTAASSDITSHTPSLARMTNLSCGESRVTVMSGSAESSAGLNGASPSARETESTPLSRGTFAVPLAYGVVTVPPAAVIRAASA
eukprot:CAMPEP_0182799602 /NCGR_PEP_ID=MMETSP0006_2-20121128/1972_1 /TAXON_ID=97485 /ORGANISM="Prymnesium parvum, Strain Texoma1" /LENGTH=145 /DNA_ID=CAMNT_0024924799 /DNA_START=149 /DNA_END=582 /DNA_ORIENTATION=-